MGRVGVGEDVARIGRDRDGDIVREILGSIETDEAVDAHALMRAGFRAEQRVRRERLTGEAIDPVQDGTTGTVERPGKRSDAHGGGEQPLEAAIIDPSFRVVVRGEGLG